MYSMEDILARLQAGEKDNDIAAEMADALNAAVAEYSKVQKRESKKKELSEALGNAMMEYLRFERPDAAEVFAKEVDVASICAEAVDEVLKLLESSCDMMVQEDKNKEKCDCAEPVKPIGCAKPAADVKCRKLTPQEVDDTLKSFLELFNL